MELGVWFGVRSFDRETFERKAQPPDETAGRDALRRGLNVSTEALAAGGTHSRC